MTELSVYAVTGLLKKMKRTAFGTDELPFWFWRDYADDLVAIITDIFNCSLQQQTVPSLWKQADIKPLEFPSTSCNQLRPICTCITAVIMCLSERLVYTVSMN